MEVIIYYTPDGRKSWTIAQKGNRVVEELVALGYKKGNLLVIDATNQIDKDIEDTFGY